MPDTASTTDAAPKARLAWPWTWAVDLAIHLAVVAAVGSVLWSVSYQGSNLSLLASGGCGSVLAGGCRLGWTIHVSSTAAGVDGS